MHRHAPGRGTDMNCDGAVDEVDYRQYLLPKLSEPENRPGPSGLACAGRLTLPGTCPACHSAASRTSITASASR